jgi:hypothetical protein
MRQHPIERTLWHGTDNRHKLSQLELLERTEPLIILGEAGMGKSHLLEWLASFPGYARCTARQLINRQDPRTLLGNARMLVIDALDEVNVQKDGDAVDLVLRRLGELGYPPFVLSCRVADWRSATGLEAIREQYDGQQPLELHLEPFKDTDAIAFLGESMGVESAKKVVDHFNSRGLAGLLGNPQTLELVTRVAGRGPLPDSRSELFERAIEVLRVEHRDVKAGAQPARDAALDAAGAAFAGLILTGNEAIVRTAEANTTEGEIQVTEISQLLGADAVAAMLGTRLFKADGADRFSYWHRRIGEYLGARWLAKLADNGRKRRRLLSLFQSHGLVPASLRGIHAWLARDPALAPSIIAADPMGVVEYGDADDLTIEQAQCLLVSLAALARTNPQFRDWGPYSLRGIGQPALLKDVRDLVTGPGTPFGLRLLILEGIKGSPIAPDLRTELQALVLDGGASFAIRHAAAEALVEMTPRQDWPAMFQILHSQADEQSLRLAIGLMAKIRYETFDDRLIVDLVVSFAMQESRILGVLTKLKHELPDARLDGVLDHFALAVSACGDRHSRTGNNQLTDFAYHLIMRRVQAGTVDAKRLWSWLRPFDSRLGHQTQTREQLAKHIREDHALRRAVQRHVLLEQPEESTLRFQAWRLLDRSTGFATSPDDIVALLAELDPSDLDDDRWREVVQLAKHNRETGAEVRTAARPFAGNRPELLSWLDGLAEPKVPEWQVEGERRDRERREQQAIRFAEQRVSFAGQIDAIHRGSPDVVVPLAMAYLGLFDDIDSDAVPAHERVSRWLSPAIGEAALSGFDAFLASDPLSPTADEIASSYAEDQYWDAGYIFVAALAERHRNGTGFAGLPDEPLLAGLFVLRHTSIDEHAGIDGLKEVVETEVRQRGLWPSAMRRYHEPQLEARRTYVDGLRTFMGDDTDAVLAADRAAEWLMCFPDLPVDPEVELIDRLVRSGRYGDLLAALGKRTVLKSEAQRRNWDAVRFLANFDDTLAPIGASEIEPELLWHIRDRAGGGEHVVTLSVAKLEWLIASFRALWPMTTHPSQIRIGDRNPWDASDYLSSLIRRLGNHAGDDATAALRHLREAPQDGYTETIRAVAAEQVRVRVESIFVPPTLDAIDAIARDRAPVTGDDLQAFMIEELALAQAKIMSDDAESWRGFYDDHGVPHDEERCRDHLLGLLRQGSPGVALEPETHVAADKEVDITCSVGKLRLPIEVKGQWHRELWQAADKQLDKLYVRDWRADQRGIYLVLWFGDPVPARKQLCGRGRGAPLPSSPEQLRDMLGAASQAVRDGRIAIVILDLSRP